VYDVWCVMCQDFEGPFGVHGGGRTPLHSAVLTPGYNKNVKLLLDAKVYTL